MSGVLLEPLVEPPWSDVLFWSDLCFLCFFLPVLVSVELV